MYSSCWAEITVSLLFLFKFPTLEYWSTLVYASSMQSKQKYQLKGLYPQSVVNHDMDKIKEIHLLPSKYSQLRNKKNECYDSKYSPVHIQFS